MHKLILFIKEFRIYKKEELLGAIASFSKKQYIVFLAFLAIALISTVIMLGKINAMFLVDVPVSGGTITEGIIGVPTLVNPVIALSDADKDLTSLVYSGLMRKTADGEFIPDLAESYTVTPDGITYTFIMKKGQKFHNGDDITADDVIFTIEKIKDPTIKSPRRMGWEGVKVTKTDDYTVVFTLESSYISFLDNTTIGILPSKLWKNFNVNEFNLSPLNTKPVGSGPYKIKSVLKNKEGIPEEYKLERFNRFALGKPMIKYFNIISYSNERDLIDALFSHSISQAGGISPEYVKEAEKEKYAVNTATLPRIFGIFFNSSKNKIFGDAEVVKAIDKAIDRQYIIDQVLEGYGAPIHNPIPEKIIPSGSTELYTNKNIEEANLILDKAGWTLGSDGIRMKGGTTTKATTKKVNGKLVKEPAKTTEATRLSFSLTTGDAPELKETTLLIKEQLKKIGIEVDIQKVYETGQLNQVIRARDYDALLFGQLINYESDLYSYWHSSQRVDPGRNIAMYNNKKVDILLESIQKILNSEERNEKYEDIIKEFDANIPAILIYSPKYLYLTSPRLNNMSLLNMTVPADRFLSVYNWSTDTDKVWKFFTK
ncbi:MAG TPA: ABC transporter substrate-binding protein [Candidatus Paceibacterota bacterium]|nr:ABC transporter substrate-binding protein [Candidatus Paceibacterota bacterium]